MIGRKRTLIFSLSKYFKFFDFRFFFRFFEAIKKNCRLSAATGRDEAALADEVRAEVRAARGEDDEEEDDDDEA